MVKICPRCGYQNTDDASFCMRCGNDLRSVQPVNYQIPPPPPQPQSGYPLGQYPPKPPFKFPMKAIIGAVIAVVAIVVVLVVVVPILTAPGYPITTSSLSSVYGGSWTVDNSHSFQVTFSSSSMTISYFNGTTKTLPLTSFNDSFIFNGNSYVYNGNMSTQYFVLFHSSSGSVHEEVEKIVVGSPLYKAIASNFSSISTWFSFNGFSNIKQNGNVYYSYYNFFFSSSGEEMIFDRSNGVTVFLATNDINSNIAAKFASMV
ncbi:zinc ribbon domain-containing protein [Sulfuracidifex tepidarius]|uniref:Zinc-ribbon domain-containing protein n=1 Tax=Sulfuracidifex tepidarius TaxID=1294262 RepID=A0A510E0I6_9CREN|nr:zinc ribbon domain-containing protein [Sulfuracidifex tepidarius]BBG26005.1 hypothetical protein IC007_0510 [Sulfuracidifex tepidarius]